tara:strand:+ start:11896 stop:12225 length:330 start_codon:yes stop_codon:yes gene_type:complete
MKKLPYYKNLVLITLVLFLFLSCENNIEFTQTKGAVNQTLSAIVGVESYNLRFNPKGKGAIIFILENQEEYTASNLNSSQLTSLLQLVSNTQLKFDTSNKEFVLKNIKL